VLFEDTYKTIESVSRSVFRDRASKFIGIAMPAAHEAEVKDVLAKLKKEYRDASHHCYAYILGFDRSAWRVNDDGEPSGTAGKPIHGQIQSKGLTNILVVVVRYFGGTKLGVSGLIHAYKTAAKEALDSASIVERTVNEVYALTFNYEQMNSVMKALKDENLQQNKHAFGLSCSLEFSVRKKESSRIYALFSKIPGVEIQFVKAE
jgi:uncharacterized YigZ family protein